MSGGLSFRLLKTDEGNALIEKLNALLNSKVMVIADNAQASSHHAAKGNSLITFTRRDLVNAIGKDTLAARNVNGPNELPGDITIDQTGVKVFNPGDPIQPGGPSLNVDGGWKPVNKILTNNNGDWLGGGCASAAAQYRSKSGTATLCGYSEFTSPSDPPKKYTKLTFSGTATRSIYSPPDCLSAPSAQFTDTWAGSNIYDPNSGCTLSVGGTQTRVYAFGGSNSVDPATDIGLGYGAGTGWTQYYTQTGSTLLSDLLCHSFGMVMVKDDTQMSVAMALSNEDTEAAAVARADLGLDYDAPGLSVAYIQKRGAGQFSFTFTDVEWRAEVSDLIAGEAYFAGVVYGRRLTGSTDPFVQFASDEINFTASGGDEFTPWTKIPNESGYDTALISLQVCPA